MDQQLNVHVHIATYKDSTIECSTAVGERDSCSPIRRTLGLSILVLRSASEPWPLPMLRSYCSKSTEQIPRCRYTSISQQNRPSDVDVVNINIRRLLSIFIEGPSLIRQLNKLRISIRRVALRWSPHGLPNLATVHRSTCRFRTVDSVTNHSEICVQMVAGSPLALQIAVPL